MPAQSRVWNHRITRCARVGNRPLGVGAPDLEITAPSAK